MIRGGFHPEAGGLMFTKDKAFYKSFVTLSLALMAEQAVILSVNLADNVMLGSYSESALSGVAAVNQIQFVLQQLVYGVSNGVIVLGSQYWGQRRPDVVKKLAAIGLWCNLAITLLLFLLVSLFPYGALSLFTSDAEIAGQGVAYLGIMRFSYMCFGLTAVMLSTMRIAETVKIALQVSILSLVINVGINFLLIPGRFGLPEMGVRGAAIGTLTARVIEFLVVAHYLFRKEKKLCMRPVDCLHIDRQMFRDYLTVSIPIITASILWGVSNAVQTMILGHMDNSAIAAQSISATLFLLLKVTSVGAASAASVIIGRTIGTGEMDRVKDYTRTLQILFLIIGAVLALLYTIIRFPLLAMYRISPETRTMANAFMNIQTLVIFTMSYQMPVNSGIIRGGGDTRFMMNLDIISQLIMYPLALAGAFLLGWPPVVILFIVNSDQIFKCIPAFIRVNSYKWVKHLTRTAPSET